MTTKVKKLNESETLFALIKGYSCLAAMVMPKAFLTGGWGISSIMLAISSVITTMCCCKLIDCGIHLNVYSYSLVVEKVLGAKGKIFLDTTIALT
jgi:amino acid permease